WSILIGVSMATIPLGAERKRENPSGQQAQDMAQDRPGGFQRRLGFFPGGDAAADRALVKYDQSRFVTGFGIGDGLEHERLIAETAEGRDRRVFVGRVRRADHPAILFERVGVDVFHLFRRIEKMQGHIDQPRAGRRVFETASLRDVSADRIVGVGRVGDGHFRKLLHVERSADEAPSISRGDDAASGEVGRSGGNRRRAHEQSDESRDRGELGNQVQRKTPGHFLYSRVKNPSSSSFLTKLISTKSSGREALALGFFGAISSRIVWMPGRVGYGFSGKVLSPISR